MHDLVKKSTHFGASFFAPLKAIVNFGSRGQNAICGIFRHQPRLKDEDLLRRGTRYVMRAIAFVEDPDVIKKYSNTWACEMRPAHRCFSRI